MKHTRVISIILVAIFLFVVPSLSQDKDVNNKSEQPKKEGKKMETMMNPIVFMKTSMGTMKIELYQNKAPISTKNFLSYVDEKFYDHTIFHRVIKTFMIQGGGFEASDPIREKKTKAPIKNESTNGLKNDRGTIAMARTMDPNSATSQFFINVVDNNGLNPGAADPNGYAVFGKVIDGMDVVDKIRGAATGDAPAIALARGQEVQTTFQDVPQTKVIVESVRRLETKNTKNSKASTEKK